MKSLILFFLFFPLNILAQLCFDFESGTLEDWIQSRDPAWGISQEDPLSGSFSLWHQLDDTLSGEDRISYAYDSLVLDGTSTFWQFTLRHAYSPSSSNKWAVFLVSDQDQEQMTPAGKSSAILLGVNFTGSDDILKLWKTEKGHTEILTQTNLNWQEVIGNESAQLRIERDPEGTWLIYRSSGLTWELIGEGKDTTYINPAYFGIYYRFSSRQDMKLWFDDLCITGTFRKDTLGPSIIAVELQDSYTLRLMFSESLDMQAALSRDKYVILPGEIMPDTIIYLSESSVELVFGFPFASGDRHTLRVQGIMDLQGNTSGVVKKDFIFFRPGPGDIIFNEIMFDPQPVIELPGYEYMELFNRSDHPARLKGWTLQAGSKMLVLPDYILPPCEYLLLCYKGMREEYKASIHTLDIMSSRTMMSNEGAVLLMWDQDSVLIDWMEYSPEMHTGEYYAEGGWSLERIDPKRTCHGEDNWTSSDSRLGGTPGMENTVLGTNPDRSSPTLRSVHLPESQKLVIEFSESMKRETVLQADAWHVDGGMGVPDSLICLQPFNRELILIYHKGFTPGKEYNLEARKRIEDCAGNPPVPGERIRFALPLQPQKAEILISEILFNPLPYCPDFIEVFNPGLKTFDLADLRLANRDTESREIVSASRIIKGHRLFFPGEYLVFTSDPEELSGFYMIHNQESLLRATDMPIMGDIQGSVLLLDKYLMVVDEFTYNRDMHHPMLASREGVSLERISYASSSGLSSNWHSASSTEGYGTPGSANSQHLNPDLQGEGIEVEPEIFSPDMDGIKDLLLIKYRFPSPGMRARIRIFDPRGRLIRDLAENQLLGTEGFFTWDGCDAQGHRARTGIYLIHAEVYGLKVGYKRYRKTCVLSTGR
ncbi:lamin tail domain-containing protein [Bacteroidota bacterium]